MSETEDQAQSEDEFTIIVEGKSLACQKSLLKEKSEYFRGMLDSCMLESQTNKVTLKGQDFSTVSTLVNFIKTGELQIEHGGRNMRKVTQAAVMLQMKEAIDVCTEYWIKTLDDGNCLELMNYSKELYLEALYSSVRRHALYYFSKVKETEGFLQLDVTEVLEYLTCQDLNCTTEIEILDAIKAWYDHDRQRRASLLVKLLSCFHIEDVREYEWESVQSHKLISESEEWRAFVEENKSKTHQKETHDRFRQLPVMIVTVGGYIEHEGSERPCTDICKFDDAEKTFKPILSLRDVFPEVGSKMGYQVTVVGKDMYISGGQLTMAHYSMILDVWKLDGFNLKWEKVTKLTSPRRHHGACGSQINLYIMGGFGKYRDILDTVQQYNTDNGKWTDLPKMPCPWFAPHTFYCENKLYVYKTNLIYLDMETLQWTCLERTPCYTDVINSFVQFIPYYFEHYMYEFPFINQEFNWFNELELGKLQIRKTSLTTWQVQAVPYCDSIQFGNRSAVCNSKFYTINRQSNELVCGSMHDFSQCKKLGTIGKAGHDCFIVAIPSYPAYKIKS